jgi:hypothetical protein
MDTQDLIFLGIAVISAVTAVVMFIRKPQEKGELNDAVFDVKFDSLEKMVVNLRDNHIHTLQCDLSKHIADNQSYVEKDIAWKTRMEGILERFHKK